MQFSLFTRNGCLTIIGTPDQLRIANFEGHPYHLQRAFFRSAGFPSNQRWNNEMRDYEADPASYSIFAPTGDNHQQRSAISHDLLVETKQATSELLNTANPAKIAEADEAYWTAWSSAYLNGSRVSVTAQGTKLHGSHEDRTDRALVYSGQPICHGTIVAIPGLAWSQARDGSDLDGEWRRTIAFYGGALGDDDRRNLSDHFDVWAESDAQRDEEETGTTLPLLGIKPWDEIHARTNRLTKDFRSYLAEMQVGH